jgi:hypothetical protein
MGGKCGLQPIVTATKRGIEAKLKVGKSCNHAQGDGTFPVQTASRSVSPSAGQPRTAPYMEVVVSAYPGGIHWGYCSAS